MGNPIINGDMIECSMACTLPPGVPQPGPLVPGPISKIPNLLTILPTCKVMIHGNFAATIMDNKPMVNIKPFQMSCGSPANLSNVNATITATIAATAAALGVPTPMHVYTPCFPNFTAPWIPPKTCTFIAGNSAIDKTSIVICANGGVVKISSASALRVSVSK
ncbi:MAG: DUF4280 domain-containing protein [Candidatus Paraimprobicoccus trichonymphae]|uniref:DUF4280 domain-containing protein n=1 Tax=Candidatus Paraimprobicoccus trichonymphae TaxID=3033793 RepID=A0AA48KXR7_9FIRM|nr:MAG: DUF4280 domain-containing protein [Candidatus Paraimprobicoccus trichonymphae]